MKKKFIALAALLAIGLASCQDEEVIKTNPNFVEKGYGALTVTMTHNGAGASTRGVGETVPAGVAFKEEKEIKSLAFIVKTEAVGTKAGSCNYYLSEEDLLSANGFTEPLTLQDPGAGDSTYTCQIKVKSLGWGTPKVLVIANYKENGVDIAGMAADWDNLPTRLKSASLTANPATPLLMFGKIDNLTTWTNQEGGPAAETIKMERLVSRIDVKNNAYNADASKGFILESAQLLNPKEYAFIMDTKTAAEINAVPTISEFPARTNVVTTAIQTLDSLYTYENTNEVGTTATALQVNGTYRGAKMSKLIAFKKADGVGTVGDPIALARNTRYVVNINPSKDSTNITWDIKVDAWTVSDTITVEPSFPVPTLKDLQLDGAAITDKVIDAPTHAGKKVTFTSSAPQASTYTVKFKYNTTGSSIKWDGEKYKDAIIQGAPVVTYATEASVTRTYEITIPAQDSIKVPLDAYVIIQNGSVADACDTITLRYFPKYEGTSLNPVMYKGQYWAPVNCGATQVPTSVSSTWNKATCGNLYQWGRKAPFDYNGSGDIAPDGTFPTYVDGTAAGYANDKFIKGSSTADYSWFSDYKNPLSDALSVGDNAWPRDQQPCPAGWRVPTKAELDPIMTEANGSNKMDGTNKIWKASSNSNFVLPAAGYRTRDTGSSTKVASDGLYWSSTLLVSGKSSRMNFYSSGASTSEDHLANGMSVRCVQE